MTDILDFRIDSKIRPTDPRILLDSGPPRALYKVNPRLILGKEWWDARRKQAYAEFLNMCAACAKCYVKLEAHELYTVDKRKGRVYLKDVVPLCYECHSFIHQDLHRALLSNGTMTTNEVRRIIKHGRDILKKFKIPYFKKDPNSSKINFYDWRMVIDGKEYPPIFDSNGAK